MSVRRALVLAVAAHAVVIALVLSATASCYDATTKPPPCPEGARWPDPCAGGAAADAGVD